MCLFVVIKIDCVKQLFHGFGYCFVESADFVGLFVFPKGSLKEMNELGLCLVYVGPTPIDKTQI